MTVDDNRLGFLTLGQSPRTDVVPVIMEIIGKKISFLESGALDGLDEKGIQALYPAPDETGIETRLGNGSPVLLAKERLIPLLEEKALRLAEKCRHVILLCSGEFPLVVAQVPALVQPVTLLRGIIQALTAGKTLGIVGPQSDLEDALLQWQPYADKVICAAASPYTSLEKINRAVAELAAEEAEIILLDDMGFTEEHRLSARKNSTVPVVCATTLTARVLSEFI